MIPIISKLMSVVLDILFPHSDVESCIEELGYSFPAHISHSKLQLSNDNSYKIRVLSLSDYGDKRISALIYALKYYGNKKAIRIIANILGDYLLEEISSLKTFYPNSCVYILPMPLHKKRRRERGFNQIEAILDIVKIRYPEIRQYINYNILIKHKETRSQTTLSKKERLENLAGSLTLNKGINLKGSYVILVDDVLTTGATVIEAYKTLSKAGIREVRVITIAKTI